MAKIGMKCVEIVYEKILSGTTRVNFIPHRDDWNWYVNGSNCTIYMVPNEFCTGTNEFQTMSNDFCAFGILFRTVCVDLVWFGTSSMADGNQVCIFRHLPQ